MTTLETQHYPIDVESVPESWSVAPLGEVLSDIQTGFASGEHNRVGDGIPHLRPMNVSPEGTIDLSDVRHVERSRGEQRLAAGDVLFNNTNSPAWVGKTALVESEEELAFSNHMTRLRAAPGVVPGFVARQVHFACRAGYFLQQCTKHVNQASIASTFLASRVPFVVAPTREQERIVTKLDALQALADAAKEALDAVPPLLEKFRQSVLAAAFRGDLTRAWREANPDVEPASELLARIRAERRRKWEEANPNKRYVEPEPVDASTLPTLPEGWCWTRLDEITEIQLGQQRAPGHAIAERQVPYVRAANITWDGLDLSDVKTMGFDNLNRYRLEVGDVLLSEASGSPMEVGKPAIWRGEIEGCCYQKTLLRVRPNFAVVTPDWLYLTFLDDALAGRFARMAPGVGILHLTAVRMASWPVPLAPIDEQSVLASVTLASLAGARQQQSYRQALATAISTLNQSILAKAFRGELVPQDPNDEPASVLLDRIRQEREAAPAKPRRGRKPASQG